MSDKVTAQNSGLGDTIDVPRDIQVCPYCNGSLAAYIESMTESDSGEWEVEDVAITCQDEGETDEDMQAHSYLPYENWMPAQETVATWLRAQRRNGETTL